jgi:spermidine synthase
MTERPTHETPESGSSDLDQEPIGGPGSALFRLGLATFGVLALELATIRWMSGQIRIFAYFNNLVLIATFLGMGLGVAIGRRRPELFHRVFPALFVFVLVVGTASITGLGGLSFPDVSIHIWGAYEMAGVGSFALNLVLVLALFWGVVTVFALASTAVGHFFGRGETLASYSFDLLGSLLGVLGFAAVTSLGVGPAVWFGVACIPLLLLAPRLSHLAWVVGVVALAAFSGRDAIYSPYNRIVVEADDPANMMVLVNQDFHQYMHDLSLERFESSPDSVRGNMAYIRLVYDIPYRLVDARDRALVIGAGTGNDAMAALRTGFQHVTSVDIDPEILRIGQRLHPEGPYDDPRVVRVVNDGRAFIEQSKDERFDVISYGLVDSHAMFSSMSSLRLENYLYSEEGLRSAWNLLEPHGLLAVSFSVLESEWLADRLFWTVAAATEQLPIAINHGLNYGRTFVVAKEGLKLDLTRVDPFRREVSSAPPEEVRTVSDDWPFLYLRPGETPWGYMVLLLGVIGTAVFAVSRVFGAAALKKNFDSPLFFMGAAFLLLETRGVTVLSLLFGSTWTVNVAVFAGILSTALAANLWVSKRRPTNIMVWFVPLMLSLALLYAVPISSLNQLDLVGRGVVGGLLIGLPVGFAGVIVSSLLDRSRNATASLGSNLLGAVLGGCLEYLSMWTGLKALVVIAMLLYAAAGRGVWQSLRAK